MGVAVGLHGLKRRLVRATVKWVRRTLTEALEEGAVDVPDPSALRELTPPDGGPPRHWLDVVEHWQPVDLPSLSVVLSTEPAIEVRGAEPEPAEPRDLDLHGSDPSAFPPDRARATVPEAPVAPPAPPAAARSGAWTVAAKSPVLPKPSALPSGHARAAERDPAELTPSTWPSARPSPRASSPADAHSPPAPYGVPRAPRTAAEYEPSKNARSAAVQAQRAALMRPSQRPLRSVPPRAPERGRPSNAPAWREPVAPARRWEGTAEGEALHESRAMPGPAAPTPRGPERDPDVVRPAIAHPETAVARLRNLTSPFATHEPVTGPAKDEPWQPARAVPDSPPRAPQGATLDEPFASLGANPRQGLKPEPHWTDLPASEPLDLHSYWAREERRRRILRERRGS